MYDFYLLFVLQAVFEKYLWFGIGESLLTQICRFNSKNDIIKLNWALGPFVKTKYNYNHFTNRLSKEGN